MEIQKMAEKQRVPLQNADHLSTQPTKKSEKVKQIAPSFRFVLNLPESNEEKCPEFNYAKLLKSAEKKRRKDKKKDENNVTNGTSNLFDDTEDDEKILDVARYFESKYGNRKKSDYVDLGAGYDESDSFIDNTDAYDEIVPEEVTTVHGGFYVNSGPLEFKDSDNAAAIVHRNNVNMDNENGNDDDDESSDEDSDDHISKRINKRSFSSSDNEEVEDVNPPKSKARVDDAEYTIVD